MQDRARVLASLGVLAAFIELRASVMESGFAIAWCLRLTEKAFYNKQRCFRNPMVLLTGVRERKKEKESHKLNGT